MPATTFSDSMSPDTSRGQIDLCDVAGDDGFRSNPSRVRNIFICSDVVFCASSRMTNASFKVRPRMNADRRDFDDAAFEQAPTRSVSSMS